jgi:hypothetical protein
VHLGSRLRLSSTHAEHAVISTFDLFSLGIGPSSSNWLLSSVLLSPPL